MSPRTFRFAPALLSALALTFVAIYSLPAMRQPPMAGQSATSSSSTSTSASPPGSTAVPKSNDPSQASPQTPADSHPLPPPSVGLNVVVLDPAHGGVDLGARGTEGIRESEVVLQFAAETKRALEAQGFQVLMTREGNDNPSFDDRSARVNAQRGAIFITLHIASTGLPGTVRTYVMQDFPHAIESPGLIQWDRAQAPFLGLSHKLGDLVQAELAKKFRGSPPTAEAAPVRQLRTTAAPAIAVEVSSVSVQQRSELDRMIPGVAEAIARGVTAFRPSYVVPGMPGMNPGTQP
jgi:N-acetylmuramoyl-L-alanine amidase